MYNQQITRIVQKVQDSSGFEKSFFILPELHRLSFQGIKEKVMSQNDVLVFGTTEEQYEKRILAFKNQLQEKKCIIKEKNPTLNQSQALVFLVIQFQR